MVESTTAVTEFRRLGRQLPRIADETETDVPAWLVKATLGARSSAAKRADREEAIRPEER